MVNSARPRHVDSSRVAIWPEKTIYPRISTVGLNPHGKVLDPCVYGPGLRVRSKTSTSVPGPLGRAPGPPLGKVRATHSKVPGFRGKGYPDLDQGQAGVRSRQMSGLYRVCFRSPLRRRPDAATRPTACDVSQRAKPDVRPLGCAVSAFVTDKARRLTGDVPPLHLMRPVTLLADGDQTFPQAACLSIPVAGGTSIPPHAPRSSSLVRCHESFPCTPILHALQISGRKEIALATSIRSSKYYIRYVLGPTCQGSAPLYVPPLSYKRGGTQRYKRRLKLTKTHLDSHTHKFIQALKLNTAHSGVGYYAPAARTTLNPCVFLCSSCFHLTGKTLRPLLI
jgi:hypothetical protein